MTQVVLDNNVLGWGILRQASPSQAEMIERTGRFLASLENDGTIVIIPAPVLTECLRCVKPEERGAFLARFIARFRVAPFDAKAAAIAASLFLDGSLEHRCPKDDELCSESPSLRRTLKYDAQIVAIASAFGVPIIYSTDERLASMAKRLKAPYSPVQVLPIPSVAEQQELALGRAKVKLTVVQPTASDDETEDEG
jgi:predicted nucleic acid-binding protein